jgi:hypothetical protein
MSERSYRASPTKRLRSGVRRKFNAVDRAEQEFLAAQVKCGQTLLERRRRIEAGEAGPVGWWQSYDSHFARPRSYAERVMALAAAQMQTEVVVHGGRLLLVAADNQNKRFAMP